MEVLQQLSIARLDDDDIMSEEGKPAVRKL